LGQLSLPRCISRPLTSGIALCPELRLNSIKRHENAKSEIAVNSIAAKSCRNPLCSLFAIYDQFPKLDVSHYHISSLISSLCNPPFWPLAPFFALFELPWVGSFYSGSKFAQCVRQGVDLVEVVEIRTTTGTGTPVGIDGDDRRHLLGIG
jgi:hypothetical protein